MVACAQELNYQVGSIKYYQNGYNGAMQNNILKIRTEKGISQQKLGELTQTSGPQINRLEKGERGLTVDWIERLAKALKVSPAAILGLETDGPLLEADPRYENVLEKVLDVWNTKKYNIKAKELIPISKKIFLDNMDAEDKELDAAILTILKHNSK